MQPWQSDPDELARALIDLHVALSRNRAASVSYKPRSAFVSYADAEIAHLCSKYGIDQRT